mmetsp:Transcript_19537/g.49694  ORF Transcript_19537/g.49694 Transcript_19537/m.49694 type:complete len:234 (+) Transcript_19537:342-1043(+)
MRIAACRRRRSLPSNPVLGPSTGALRGSNSARGVACTPTVACPCLRARRSSPNKLAGTPRCALPAVPAGLAAWSDLSRACAPAAAASAAHTRAARRLSSSVFAGVVNESCGGGTPGGGGGAAQCARIAARPVDDSSIVDVTCGASLSSARKATARKGASAAAAAARAAATAAAAHGKLPCVGGGSHAARRAATVDWPSQRLSARRAPRLSKAACASEPCSSAAASLTAAFCLA